MDWITTKEASVLWDVTTRQVQLLCDRGKVKGAEKLGDIWVMPKGTSKPEDGRRKNGRKPVKND